ncbi:hypothetical protein ACFL1X_04290 [Candidatus Hydrogenedentota bacterium]
MNKCHSCGTEWDEVGRLMDRARCDSCDAPLHCCLNCKLYAPYAHNHCESPTTELAPDVEAMNHCPEFIFRDSSHTGGQSEADKSKSEWDNLFG